MLHSLDKRWTADPNDRLYPSKGGENPVDLNRNVKGRTSGSHSENTQDADVSSNSFPVDLVLLFVLPRK
jgi:hypothetical protein